MMKGDKDPSDYKTNKEQLERDLATTTGMLEDYARSRGIIDGDGQLWKGTALEDQTEATLD